jgi:hypothetical protein
MAAAAFLWAVTAQAQSDKSDFDLVCAITTGAQLSFGQDEQRSAATMAHFCSWHLVAVIKQAADVRFWQLFSP